MVDLSRRFLAGASAIVRSFSTNAKASADSLYRRLSGLGHKKGTVAYTINEYIRQGKQVGKFELTACIRELRKYRRYHQALEIMEWMESRKLSFAHKEYAIRVDLIAKANGIESAENYFNALAPSARVHCTYGALLNCYCEEKMIDKAIELFSMLHKEKMITGPLPYNNLMNMYLRLGQPDKVVVLAEEMKKNNIQPDAFTCNLLMNSYSSLDDLQGVERVFQGMKVENQKVCDWTIYSTLANIYIRSGYREKAELALKNLEKEMGPRDREAHHFLISLYAGIHDLHNVHRVWKCMKSRMRVMTNKSYLMMVQALRKLKDVSGLKKCYEEWESVYLSYDIRLPETAIGAFLEHGMIEEAEKALGNAVAGIGSSGDFFKAWEMFMAFYLNNNRMKEALEIMEIATMNVRGDVWRPKFDSVDKLLEYFKGENDVDSVERMYKCMKRMNRNLVDRGERIEEDGVRS